MTDRPARQKRKHPNLVDFLTETSRKSQKKSPDSDAAIVVEAVSEESGSDADVEVDPLSHQQPSSDIQKLTIEDQVALVLTYDNWATPLPVLKDLSDKQSSWVWNTDSPSVTETRDKASRKR